MLFFHLSIVMKYCRCKSDPLHFAFSSFSPENYCNEERVETEKLKETENFLHTCPWTLKSPELHSHTPIWTLNVCVCGYNLGIEQGNREREREKPFWASFQSTWYYYIKKEKKPVGILHQMCVRWWRWPKRAHLLFQMRWMPSESFFLFPVATTGWCSPSCRCREQRKGKTYLYVMYKSARNRTDAWLHLVSFPQEFEFTLCIVAFCKLVFSTPELFCYLVFPRNPWYSSWALE